MTPAPPFRTRAGSDLAINDQEYRARLAAVRGRMADLGLDVCLVSTPENIFWLTGLDHWGYFAPHLLVVPALAEMVLIARAMEKVTVANQVRNAAFAGHEDSETVADVAVRLLRTRGAARIGLEAWSSGLPYGLAQTLASALPPADWVDVSGLIDALRLVKSPAEQRCLRTAAVVSDAAMQAAIGAIRAGASEREVAAECHRAMIAAGGAFPGFGPFIRPTARLGEEHTTWGEGTLAAGDTVLLELAGCVRRYHAPLRRLVFVGEAPDGAGAMRTLCLDAFDAAVDALRPGALAREVYAAWQRMVDRAGLGHYRRHHCGYVVGVGFPPSWTGGNRVMGLRRDSDLEIRTGMSFHILSWLMGAGRGDAFVSDTVLLTEAGPEVLTTTPRTLTVR